MLRLSSFASSLRFHPPSSPFNILACGLLIPFTMEEVQLCVCFEKIFSGKGSGSYISRISRISRICALDPVRFSQEGVSQVIDNRGL